MKKILFALASVLLLPPVAFATHLRIAQVDNSDLLLGQVVHLYLSLTDDQGEAVKGIEAQDLKVLEGPSADDLQPLDRVVGFKQASNFEEGVSFLLLLDNSGSMYRTLEGQPTTLVAEQRITVARGGIKSFLESATNPKDRFGLVAYNSFYQDLSPMKNDQTGLLRQLEALEKPTGDAVYTELYGSIQTAAQNFLAHKGRKALIILSDGENSPYFQNTQQPHPVFGTDPILWSQALEQLQLEGISLYAIAFGPKGADHDRFLRQIAVASGGAVFDAHNEGELKEVYQKILRQILGEYRLSYKAGMGLEDRRYVQARLEREGEQALATRFYYSGGLLHPKGDSYLVPILAALLSLLAFWGLTKVKFEHHYPKPHLEILEPGGAQVSTRILDLGQGQTVIGGAADANLTIIGGKGVAEHHATIVFDPKAQHYTIAAQGALEVNNRSVQTKVLESGDLIRIGSTTLVFGQEDLPKG